MAWTDHVSAVNWQDASRRVIRSYRDWVRAVRTPSAGRSAFCLRSWVEDFKTDGTTTGTRDPADVLSYNAGLRDTDENAAGVRKT